jgi:hypothetical protein
LTDSTVATIIGIMTPFFDRVPVGWFVLAVLRHARGADWVALAADKDPAVAHISASAWVRIPGKHRSRDEAFDALEAMMAMRH